MGASGEESNRDARFVVAVAPEGVCCSSHGDDRTMQDEPKPLKKRASGRPRRYVSGERIHELRRQGLSFRQIARKTGFGYGTVRRAYWASVEAGTAAAD